VAQVFPLTAGDSAVDDAGAVLAGTLAALPEEWTVLRARRIGDAAADGVLVHPGVGVALIDLAPEPPEAARAALQGRLERERFSQFFPGELPIVAVGVTEQELESIGEKLQAAFEAAPSLDIADPDWADAVIELLLQPEDMAMTPVGAATAPEPTIPAPASPRAGPQRTDPPREERLREERLQQERLHEEQLQEERLPRERLQQGRSQQAPFRGDPAREDPFVAEPPLDQRFYAAPLRAEYPLAYDLPRRRRPGRTAAIIIGALVVIGAAMAAWSLDGNEGIPTAMLRQAEIEVPLAGPPTASAPASLPRETKTEPPPLPAAPPVLMAAKQMIEPPPPAPRPTMIAPLPQVVVQAAPPQPSQQSASPAPVAPVESAPRAAAASPQPPQQSASPAPAAPVEPAAREAAAAKPHAVPRKRSRPVLAEKKPPEAKPQREARTESPAEPKPEREARQEPNDTQQMMQHELSSDESKPATSETGARPPPIDADELPPLPASSAPLALVPPAVPPPPPFPPPAAPAAQAASPPSPAAAPSIQEGAATGPPVQLVRQPVQPSPAANGAGAPASAAASAATPQRECRPYTSTTTLTGNAVAVQGIACRDGDGPWRLVSEVPAQ
jgi:hypothetical protein